MMKFLLAVMLLSLTMLQGNKEKVKFPSEDGLEITADKYLVNEEYPYILLFHQAGSSRGEFRDIAEKILKLRYNCLAVDLRSGDNANFVNNETASRARGAGKSVNYLDARDDMVAAIDYAYDLNARDVILLGSSYSASLALLEGMTHPRVGAVIAFSPGEYFGNDLRLEDSLKTCSKPLFVAVTNREQPYVKQMLSAFSEDDYTLFQPDTLGVHGARALWDDNPGKDEYWLALLMFINNLNK
jgi:pimeloyl-ACP methyl ester carboxylesterase